MAHTPPFFQHTAHVTGLMAPAPVLERYPFHDNDECPIGQEVKTSGQWQYYEPTLITETRPRCPTCVQLGRASRT
ncbi:hypothetical protein [Hymenobacter lucidus]|uniref:Zinc-finger domain-containing protein n=1 Tax=Hymenobacter lucidus TaxID=2880930 RepID=A0ABS8AY36_9BACT|nr:hypothetical protein [Hymenobacter lucidus]MCB2410704.1 hypothetical protein [Hymenobacter lucidus]